MEPTDKKKKNKKPQSSFWPVLHLVGRKASNIVVGDLEKGLRSNCAEREGHQHCYVYPK